MQSITLLVAGLFTLFLRHFRGFLIGTQPLCCLKSILGSILFGYLRYGGYS